MHPNLLLVSCLGEEYTSGVRKDWDVEAEYQNLELSFATLDIGGDATGSRVASSINPQSSFVEQTSCSIFVAT